MDILVDLTQCCYSCPIMFIDTGNILCTFEKGEMYTCLFVQFSYGYVNLRKKNGAMSTYQVNFCHSSQRL